MSSRGTKFGRKLCLAGFYHCWDYCLPRSLPVPLVGLVGWCQCGKWGSSDLGVLLMAFFTLSVVFCHPGHEPHGGTLGTLASPELSSLLLLPPSRLHRAVAGRSPPLPGVELFTILCLGQHFAFYQEASELWRQICLYNRFYKASRRMLATAA